MGETGGVSVEIGERGEVTSKLSKGKGETGEVTAELGAELSGWRPAPRCRAANTRLQISPIKRLLDLRNKCLK